MCLVTCCTLQMCGCACKLFKITTDPGLQAGMIAALHVGTHTDVQMALKSVCSLASICLRAWQNVQP